MIKRTLFFLLLSACAFASMPSGGPYTKNTELFVDGGIHTGDILVSGTSQLLGPVWADGGVYLNTTLVVDGGSYYAQLAQYDAGIFSPRNITGATFTSTSGLFIGNVRSDGGQTSIFTFDPTGNVGTGGPGYYAAAGVSLPQTGHFDGFFPGPASFLNNGLRFQTTRFYAPGAFVRLSVTASTTGTTSTAQTLTVDVYDRTTSTVLCVSSAIACDTSAPAFFGVNCPGTAKFATFDDIDLRINNLSCTTTPLLNVSSEYVGP